MPESLVNHRLSGLRHETVVTNPAKPDSYALRCPSGLARGRAR
ncbi:hypothetical protein [Nocardia brasiliensis]|nr:hypothetical protein [Nocardia brasiliensis]